MPLTKKNECFKKYQIVMLCFFMTLLVIAFFPLSGPDGGHWQNWGFIVFQKGWVNGYAQIQDVYPPLGPLILGLSVSLVAPFTQPPFQGMELVFAVKIVLLAFLSISMWGLYQWTQKIEILFFSFLVLFFITIVLFYIDILVAPFLIFSFYFMEKGKKQLAVVLFVLAAMVKYPVLIIAPFFLVYFVFQNKKFNGKLFLFYGFTALLTLSIFIFLHFEAMLDSFTISFKQYSHIPTSNAQNIHFALMGMFDDYINQDIQRLSQIMNVFFILFYSSSLLAYFFREKNLDNLLLYAIVGHMAYFILCVGVHENHLFLSSLLAIILACRKPQYLLLAISLGAISSFNMYSCYFYPGSYDDMEFPKWLMSIFNTIYYFGLWFAVVVFRRDASFLTEIESINKGKG